MINYAENPVNRDIIDQLLDRLDYIRIQPKTILMLGEHIDYAVDQLQQRYPFAIIKKVNDAALIHQAENSAFDLVIAHFALLRVQEPMQFMLEFSRILRDEGLLLLTSLGPDTFFELRDSFSKADDYAHVDTFLDMHHIGDWMKQLHFSDPVVDRAEIIVAYDDLNDLFDDLKNLNLRNKNPSRFRGLLTKNKLEKIRSHYEKYKTEDYFPATLEVIFGHGWKVPLPDQDESDREITISVDSILRK